MTFHSSWTFPVTCPSPWSATWREWKRLAVAEVLNSGKFFKGSSSLSLASPEQQQPAVGPGDFALRVPLGGGGGMVVLGPGSVHDDKVPDRTLLHALACAAGGACCLVYMPVVRVCTFDNLDVAVPSFGHWLLFTDQRASPLLATTATSTPPAAATAPRQTIDLGLDSSTTVANDAILNEDSQEALGKLLIRTATFMKNELELAPDQYVISVGFGQFMRREETLDTLTRVCARVQVLDARIHLLLLLKYERNLLDEVRLPYLVHARQFWMEARQWAFLQFAMKDEGELDRWLLQQSHDGGPGGGGGRHDPATTFRLPKGFTWDEYGRQQITTELLAPLCELTGALGGLNPKLKAFVRSVQTATVTTGSRDVLLSVHNKMATLLLTVRDYLHILQRAGADPVVWGNALGVALRDSPDVLYAQLFSDFGLSANLVDGLPAMAHALHLLDQQSSAALSQLGGKKQIAVVVDQSALPLPIDVIRKIEGRNKYKQRFSAVPPATAVAGGGGGGGGEPPRPAVPFSFAAPPPPLPLQRTSTRLPRPPRVSLE